MKPLLDAVGSPLSSIFGSGFLVIVPILAGAVGPWAPLAMVAVCALAFALGGVIRYNIRHAEPVLANAPPRAIRTFETASDVALVLAYVISVALYLHILSSFVLAGFGADSDRNVALMTTAVIVLITAIGALRSLSALDRLEIWGLYVSLAIIVVLVAAFARYGAVAAAGPEGITLPAPADHSPWAVITIVAGTLIVVQGFETPRYLGDRFDADTRIRASRLAQIVSTAVYVAFVAVTLPAVHTLNGAYDDNALIALVGTAAAILSVPLVVAAVLSQFAAAVADTHAATGNMAEVSRGRLPQRVGCVVVGAAAIALTWVADTSQIIALASRAFAFYYLLQCAVGLCVAASPARRAWFAALAVLLAFVTLFAVPAG